MLLVSESAAIKIVPFDTYTYIFRKEGGKKEGKREVGEKRKKDSERREVTVVRLQSLEAWAGYLSKPICLQAVWARASVKLLKQTEAQFLVAGSST